MDYHFREKRRILSRFSKGFYIGIALLVLGIAMFVTMICIYCITSANMSKYQVISNEESLRKALAEDPILYRLTDIPLTGEVCDDPVRILTEPYVYLEYTKYHYVENRTDNGTEYRWERSNSSKLISRPRKYFVFGDIPIAPGDYEVEAKPLQDIGRVANDEAASHVYSDGGISYYYPEKIENRVGNTRFSIHCVPVGADIAFFAEVGDGKICPKGFHNDKPKLICGGTLDSIDGTAVDDLVYFMGLIGVVLAVVGLFMFVIGLINGLRTPRSARFVPPYP